jgi:DNA polymerase elongation subunit (family B)
VTDDLTYIQINMKSHVDSLRGQFALAERIVDKRGPSHIENLSRIAKSTIKTAECSLNEIREALLGVEKYFPELIEIQEKEKKEEKNEENSSMRISAIFAMLFVALLC